MDKIKFHSYLIQMLVYLYIVGNIMDHHWSYIYYILPQKKDDKWYFFFLANISYSVDQPLLGLVLHYYKN